MKWFNINGLFFIIIMMIPNILYAIKYKDEFENLYKNKTAEIFEQIGRYGCFATMIFNVPYTYLGPASDNILAIYLTVNVSLLLLYSFTWVFTFYENNLFKAYALSILPSLMFLTSGILYRSILLTDFALIFAPCHILISVKNCQLKLKNS